jgi:NADH pyrophosphatase NudC (nudix superfamily)
VIIVLTCVLAIAVIAFILGVRAKDLPAPEPVSPFQHLDERKAAIYENLRDLQFEYRVGKLSDTDYQATKKDLQKELAGVLAEVDKIKLQLNGAGQASAAAVSKKKAPAAVSSADSPSRESKPTAAFVCDSCGASFEKSLKFCGECGKPMKVAQ